MLRVSSWSSYLQSFNDNTFIRDQAAHAVTVTQ
jgi:hypothetical protein